MRRARRKEEGLGAAVRALAPGAWRRLDQSRRDKIKTRIPAFFGDKKSAAAGRALILKLNQLKPAAGK